MQNMLFAPVLPFHGLCGTPSSKRSLDHFDEDSLWPITEVLMPSGEFSTPKKAAKKNQRACCTPGPSTPDGKTTGFSTPPVPDLMNKRMKDDIDAALVRGSVPLLSLALLRHHKCYSDHCLHEAITIQNVKALSFLLENGVHGVDEHCGGFRPLHLAVNACMVEHDTGYNMAKLLLQNSACPDKCPGDLPDVEAPIFDAMRRGCAAAVELLLCHGANVDAVDANGRSALHVACQKVAGCEVRGWEVVHRPIISLLLKHGALREKLKRSQQDWTRCQLARVGGRAAVQEGCPIWEMDEFTMLIASFT